MSIIQFASWNANLGKRSGARGHGKHDFLDRLDGEGVDIMALQEVSTHAIGALQQSTRFAVLPSPAPGAVKMCALLLGPRVKVVTAGGPFALPAAAVPSPKETVWAKLIVDGRLQLTVASFHLVPGSMRGATYGREAKRMNFRGFSEWLAKQPTWALAGVDANSPVVDAFCPGHGPTCLCQTRYFPGRLLAPKHGRRFDDPYADRGRSNWRFDQEEDRLHDPGGRDDGPVRGLRDAYRTYLALDGIEAQRALDHYQTTASAQGGEGCLARTTLNRRRARRFDFVYVTPDLLPIRVEHLTERPGVLVEGEHAAVIATFRFEATTEPSQP